MKKVMGWLLMCLMALGAKNASADAIIAAQQADGRIVNSIDVIFAGYVNKIVEYKNTVDFRLNSNGGILGGGTGEWGGIIDGKHDSLGVIGVYINRPTADVSYNGAPTLWGPAGGVAAWTGAGVGVPGGVLPGAWITAGNGSVAPAGFAILNGAVPTPLNKVDIFWAKDSGDSSFGVGLSYGDNQANNGIAIVGGNGTYTNSDATVVPTNQVDDTYARNLALNVGLGLKNVLFTELDIHAGYNYGTFAVNDSTNAAAGTSTDVFQNSIKDNGISSITLGAMAQSEMDKDSSLRLFLDGALNSFGTKTSMKDSPNNDGTYNAAGDSTYDNTTSWSQLVLNAGFGCNHSVNDGAAVIGSSVLANFSSYGTSATESSTAGAGASTPTNFTTVTSFSGSSINISWGANVDSKVTDWLKVRAGIRKSIFNRTGYNYGFAGTTNTITGKGTADAFANANAAFSTGFGIHWQNWVVNSTVTAASLESSLANVQPGNGLLFAGNIVTAAEIDLGYAF